MTESVPTQELTELILQQTRMQLEAELDSIIKQYYKDDYNIQIKADILSEQCIHIECIELTLLQEYEYIEQLKNRLMNYYPECEFKIKTEVTGG